MKLKKCLLCGKEFIPNSSAQKYCNQPIEKTCSVCGRKYISICNPGASSICGDPRCKELSGVVGVNKSTKICELCGKPFHPNSSRQKYCNREITKICVVCGNSFISRCNPSESDCCSTDCKNKYAQIKSKQSIEKMTRFCNFCGKPFHPEHSGQYYCKDKHYFNCVICGKQFEIDVTKQDRPVTCSKECAIKLRFKDGNPFSKPECREKGRQTYFRKTGFYHPGSNPEVQQKMMSTYKSRTGYDHPSHNPYVRSKAAKANKHSSLERRLEQFLSIYNIKYISQYTISKDNQSHCYDFYLPDYNIYVDCDGVYYHGYISDPDGKQVLECYDETRLSLIPDDAIFHIIVELQFEKGANELKHIIESIDSEVFNYDSYIFKWCRDVGFPYPQYTHERMIADFNALKRCDVSSYNFRNLLGMSSIRNFHKSIYDAHVRNKMSPKEAWDNDEALKKIIANRLIYVNNVDPSKVLVGFSVTKLAPKVSVFNPVLAKYLINKYLSSYSTIFDPFSGFSGRMLGSESLNKFYIGSDISSIHVNESNHIIQELGLEHSSILHKDIFDYNDTNYECVFTCPPYGTKETYGSETKFKSCDDWITYILNTFQCKHYLFVVDTTAQYKDNIVETLHNTSHFNGYDEYVIFI